MRSKFDEQLALLSRELTQMGALCEEVIALAAKSITTGDVAIAEKVAPLDGEIDRMEHSIEALCLKLLLQQQPVHQDQLRQPCMLQVHLHQALQAFPFQRFYR